MATPIKMSLVHESIPLELETGSGTLYAVLTVISGSKRDSFLKFYSEKLRVRDGKAQTVENMTAVQIKLLEMSLFRAKLDEAGQPVPSGESYEADEPLGAVEIGKWPAYVIDYFFKEAMSLNKLDESDEDSKND